MKSLLRSRAHGCALLRSRASLAVLLLSGIAASAQAEPLKLSHRDRLYDATSVDGKLFVVGHPGLLLRSSDGGTSFASVAGGQKDEALFSIAFNTKGQGAAVGRSGVLLTSEDKGAHWQKAEIKFGDERPSLFGVDVLDDGTIVAVGDFGVIARSEDRGKSWTRSPYSVELTASSEQPAGCAVQGAADENSDMIQEARLTDVGFVDDKRGLITGEFGLVLETSDGGRTFQRLNSCTERTLYGLAVIDDKHSIAVGANGTAVETVDGGRTWTALETGTVEHLFGAWADSKRALLVGAAGTVLTRSAGKPLSAVSSGVHSWLVSAQLDSKGAGVIVGGRAQVLKTSDGGNTQSRVMGE